MPEILIEYRGTHRYAIQTQVQLCERTYNILEITRKYHFETYFYRNIRFECSTKIKNFLINRLKVINVAREKEAKQLYSRENNTKNALEMSLNCK